MPLLSPAGLVVTAGEVQVEVNRGRWIIRCPGCAARDFADEDTQGLTMAGRGLPLARTCVRCGMALRIRWPDQIGRIEDLLRRRPPVAQNWLPHESAEDLADENEYYGILDLVLRGDLPDNLPVIEVSSGVARVLTGARRELAATAG